MILELCGQYSGWTAGNFGAKMCSKQNTTTPCAHHVYNRHQKEQSQVDQNPIPTPSNPSGVVSQCHLHDT